MENLFPTQTIISRKERSNQKRQKSAIIWLTGLSGAGKSTIAILADKKLTERGHHTYVLDGDNIRSGINKGLGFSDEDRHENIRRVGEMGKLFVDAGIIVLTAFISPFKQDRREVRKLFPGGDFVEVYVDAPLATCEQRDPKNIYAMARENKIQDFTGITSMYEIPENPELVLHTDKESEEESVNRLLDYLEKENFLGYD